jgi:tRNA A37 threonylcarbamoyladenosine synthetase subunit TsaC/SUA5/YrdC
MQTDTTVGFLSQNADDLYKIKSRKTTKPFIKVYSNFKTLLACGNRIPNKFKSNIRRSKKTTFIVKNRAFRVAKFSLHSNILKNISWHYSTSANETKKYFHRDFCEDKADIIIEDKNGLHERKSSSLYKINNIKRKKIR